MIRRLSHTLQALAFMAAYLLLPKHPLVGALFALLPLLWREVAQAEEREIDGKYGTRAKMPWWRGWAIGDWTMHSIRDVAVPALVVALVASAVMVLP